jgi:hypothetical protein
MRTVQSLVFLHEGKSHFPGESALPFQCCLKMGMVAVAVVGMLIQTFLVQALIDGIHGGMLNFV